MDNEKENHRVQLTTLNNTYMLPGNYSQVATGCSQHREQSSTLGTWQTQRAVCLSMGLSSSGPAVCCTHISRYGWECPARTQRLWFGQGPVGLCCPTTHIWAATIGWVGTFADDETHHKASSSPCRPSRTDKVKNKTWFSGKKRGRRAKYIKSILLDLKCKWYISQRQTEKKKQKNNSETTKNQLLRFLKVVKKRAKHPADLFWLYQQSLHLLPMHKAPSEMQNESSEPLLPKVQGPGSCVMREHLPGMENWKSTGGSKPGCLGTPTGIKAGTATQNRALKRKHFKYIY